MYSLFVSCNFSVEVLLWEIQQWIVGILMCEGGDVERWLEPPLNSQLFISCIVIIAHTYTCLILFVCSHLCSTKRAIEAPKLIIQRNSEEKFQSPSREIRTHSWLNIVCQLLVFKFRFICPRIALQLFPFLQVYFHKVSTACKLMTEGKNTFNFLVGDAHVSHLEGDEQVTN